MSISVKLIVTKGKEIGNTYNFDSPCSIYIGRHSDCNIVLSEPTVSRFHCLLDIVPPTINIRDFGSLNGTFVNGILIGKRNKDQSIEDGQNNPGSIICLKSGDKLQFGFECEIKVQVNSDLVCNQCKKTVGLSPNDFVLINDTEILCKSCNELYEKRKSNNRKKCDNLIINSIVRDNNSTNKELFPGYQTIHCLGRGGMGEVWLATSIHDGKKYAIKRMLPKIASVQQSRDAFLREVSFFKQLNHKNIIAQYSHGHNCDELFIVMEYCNGGSVDNQMRVSKKLFSITEALNCIIQSLDGLSYAHTATIETKLPDGKIMTSKGLVHRDFKPSNIFIQKENSKTIFKVADFGLAKAFEIAGLSGHTKAGQVGGTPAFMPRQQVLNFKYTGPEVDVWAAAASLYYMLTGFTPKYNKKKDPWLVAVTESSTPIRKRTPSIPKKLAEIIDDALVDTPSMIYKSAQELRDHLFEVYEELL